MAEVAGDQGQPRTAADEGGAGDELGQPQAQGHRGAVVEEGGEGRRRRGPSGGGIDEAAPGQGEPGKVREQRSEARVGPVGPEGLGEVRRERLGGGSEIVDGGGMDQGVGHGRRGNSIHHGAPLVAPCTTATKGAPGARLDPLGTRC